LKQAIFISDFTTETYSKPLTIKNQSKTVDNG